MLLSNVVFLIFYFYECSKKQNKRLNKISKNKIYLKKTVNTYLDISLFYTFFIGYISCQRLTSLVGKLSATN